MFDDYIDSETEPEEDDCSINGGSFGNARHASVAPALNKAYKNNSSVESLLQQLLANDKKFKDEVRLNAGGIKFHDLVDERWFAKLGSDLFVHVP